MGTRPYEFANGPETPSLPDPADPADPDDILTLEFADARYSKNTSWRSKRVSMAAGISSKAVVFDTPMSDANYTVYWSIENLIDPGPIWLQAVVSARSNTGFTLKFNAELDTANYVLHYVARAD